MAPHSGTLAWKTLWMEEPGGLQFMGSQRVGHYWATNTHKWYHVVFVSFWLTSLSMIISGQGGLACCNSWGCKQSWLSYWTELSWEPSMLLQIASFLSFYGWVVSHCLCVPHLFFAVFFGPATLSSLYLGSLAAPSLLHYWMMWIHPLCLFVFLFTYLFLN